MGKMEKIGKMEKMEKMEKIGKMGKMEKMGKIGKKQKMEKMGKRGKWGKWRKWSNVKCSLSAAGAKAAVRSNFGCRLSLVGKSHSINFIGGLFVCYLEATLRCYLHL